MDKIRLKSWLETLIFVGETPLKIVEMLEAVGNLERAEAAGPAIGSESASEGEAQAPSQNAEAQLQAFAEAKQSEIGRPDIQEALQELEKEYLENPGRGILLSEVGGGWQFRTRPENAAIIREFFQPKPPRLSKPSLETMAIVAYRQPITRVEIDAIRGVDSGGVLKTLLEKNLVRIVGKKDEPGKPMLYGTTQDFLELFQLKGLKELPTLKEFRELEEEFQRNSGAEGVIVENVADDSEPQDFSLDAAPAKAALAQLEEVEEEEIEELEQRIKDLRHLERGIFAEEKKDETIPEGSDKL